MKTVYVAIMCLVLPLNLAFAQTSELGPPNPEMVLGQPLMFQDKEKLDIPDEDDRKHYRITKATRGNTLLIPEEDVAELCGDFDGCSIRLGMYNWDQSGRVASRTTLFYYNTTNHAWRASAGDPVGQDYDGTTQHPLQAWACYFTDGKYVDWVNKGDPQLGFGLLSWKQYNAGCRLTIID